MPNRIIKDSFQTSDKIASLTDFEFRLWVSLIVSVDDAGRGDARPAIIKGHAFPLRESALRMSRVPFTVWRPKAAFLSTKWTGSPTFGSQLGLIIKGYVNANLNILRRRRTASLLRPRQLAATCRLNPIRIQLIPPLPPKGGV